MISDNVLNIGFLGDTFVDHRHLSPNVESDLKKMLRFNDFNIANLEGPITKAENPIRKSGASICQSECVVELLDSLNVNIVGLANNHISDYGKLGIIKTLKTLDSFNIKYIGAGESFASTYTPLRICHKGLTISIVSASENGFGCLSNEYFSDWGYSWLFHPRLQLILAKEIKETDHVVIYSHGGVEHMTRPLPQWRIAYHRFIDMGVSAVIAHHPHISQGIETYQGAPIAYSLGNTYFLYDWLYEHCYHAQIATLSFNKKNNVSMNLSYTKFHTNNSGNISIDHSEWGKDRCDTLSSELISKKYDEQLIHDLNILWDKKYRRYLETGLSSSSSLRRSFKNIKNAITQDPRRNKWYNPVLILALQEIESHRWFYSSYMQYKAKMPLSNFFSGVDHLE